MTDLTGFVVDVAICWEDKTWTDDILLYIAEESDVYDSPDLLMKYFSNLPEDKRVLENENGCSAISYIFIPGLAYESISNLDPGEVLLVCSFYVAHNVILEMQSEYSKPAEEVFSCLKIAAEFQSIFQENLLNYLNGEFNLFNLNQFEDKLLSDRVKPSGIPLKDVVQGKYGERAARLIQEVIGKDFSAILH